VVLQPQPDFGNARGPFADFDAVKLVNIHFRQVADV